MALFPERKVTPRRPDDSTRWIIAALSNWFVWRNALGNVQADALLRWHRQGFRLVWPGKSKTAGRPRLPINLQALIRELAVDNPSRRKERVANELRLKLGILVSSRTVAKYLRRGGLARTPDRKQRWLTFVYHHAKGIVAGDFFVVMTATVCSLCLNMTNPYRFVLQDRDIIFSRELDKAVTRLGLRVLRSPVRVPKVNAFCERLGGSLHRECLDVRIPFNEGHLRRIVKAWMLHDNRGRPHGS